MAYDLEAILGKATYNAQQWIIAIEEHIANRPDDDKQAKALKIAKRKIMAVLIGNLKDAIAKPAGGHGGGEFDTEVLRAPLLSTFDNEEIIQIADGIVDFEEGALQLAGDWQDWADGIEGARASLGLGGGDFTKKQRAKFWRDFIYGPARIGMDPNIYAKYSKKEYSEGVTSDAKERYDATIQARFLNWEGGAPYWLVLEHGNHGNDLAFPRFTGTDFLEKSRREAQLIYNQELLNVENLEENIVLEELQKFVDNPDEYEPGVDPLAVFYSDSQEQKIYITRTKRIGVSLRPRFR